MKASTVLSFILGAAAGAAFVIYHNCKSSICCEESECGCEKDSTDKPEEEK